ncbi:MAG: mechanosensitive ion channel [Cyanobacteria bacterium K_DeepCast_35m_m1_288]|nr:mechanosensitive ion channel [Cyanobacteria bacterium K_DeepCast_35m_m1_288]
MASRELGQPVAVSACITIGYDVPWRQVHALLLEAASTIDGICQEPAPSVVQTSLNDWHVSYELDARIEDANQYRSILSLLLAAIQDSFADAGVEILSPAYEVQREGSGLRSRPVDQTRARALSASTNASTKQTEALIPRCRGTTQVDKRANTARPRAPSTSTSRGGSQAGIKVNSTNSRAAAHQAGPTRGVRVMSCTAGKNSTKDERLQPIRARPLSAGAITPAGAGRGSTGRGC